MDDLIPLGLGPVMLRPDLLAEGLTDRDIGVLVRNGALHRLRHGAYAIGPDWRNADADARHALLARAVVRQARTDVVLSHVSALPEYGAPTWNLPLDVVHLTRKDRRAGRKERGVRQHQGVLLDGDVVTRNGVKLTSPDRTPLDITTLAGVEPSLVVMNYFLHEGLTTPERLQQRYDRMRKDPFTLRTDLVLRLADGRIESVGESRTVFLCWRHSVPAPVPQWRVYDDAGGLVARLDFAWPELGLWMEFDGREKYLKYLEEGETVVDAVLREKQRESRIAEITDWRCIRITWADLEQPERTAARIIAFLQRASRATTVTS
ncbi:MAG: hypothetical protein WAV00_14285 [Nocardioides sp.]